MTTITASDVAALLGRAAKTDLGDVLRPTPIYCCLESAGFPVADFLPTSAVAIGGSRLDLVFQTWLENRGEWRGRGFAFAIRDQGRTYRDVLGLAVHELAHALESWAADGCDLRHDPPPSTVEADHQRAVTFLDNDKAESALPPFWEHSATWVRITIHLWHRLNKLLGDQIPLAAAFDASQYGLSDELRYQRALDHELDAWVNKPLVMIAKTPSPSCFIGNWEADISVWAGHNSAALEESPVAREITNNALTEITTWTQQGAQQ